MAKRTSTKPQRRFTLSHKIALLKRALNKIDAADMAEMSAIAAAKCAATSDDPVLQAKIRAEGRRAALFVERYHGFWESINDPAKATKGATCGNAAMPERDVVHRVD